LFLDAARTSTVEGTDLIPSFGIFNRVHKLPADPEKVLTVVMARG
jgi:hypothetical protein